MLNSKLAAGRLAAKFTVAKSEVGFSESNPPLFLQLSCFAYLGFFIPKIDEFFLEHKLRLGDKRGSVWFSAAGTPVPWNLHFGTVVDLLFAGQAQPFCFEVHFKEYPSCLSEFGGSADVEEMVMHNIKEGVLARTGNKELLRMELHPKDQMLLFKCLGEQNFEDIALILKPFVTQFKRDRFIVRVVHKGSGSVAKRTATSQQTVAQFLNDNFNALFRSDGRLQSGDNDWPRVTCCGVDVELDTPIAILAGVFEFFDFGVDLVVTV